MPWHPPRDATISMPHCEAHAQEIIVVCEFNSGSDAAYFSAKSTREKTL